MPSETQFKTVTLHCEAHGDYDVREIVGFEHLTRKVCQQCQKERATAEKRAEDEAMARIDANVAEKAAVVHADPLAAKPMDDKLGIIGRRMDSCDLHGEFVATHFRHRDIWSTCPECRREKQERESEERRQADLKAAQIRRAQALLDQSRIPLRFQDATFDTYRVGNEAQQQNLDTLREYAERFPEYRSSGGGLILCGRTGTGKTHLVTALGREVIERHGMSFLFVTANKIFTAIKNTYGNTEKRESDVYDALAGVDLLAIDEIGVQKGSDFELNVLFEVINRRYEDMLPTILLSNLAKDEIKAAVGDRVMDRMRQGGRMIVFDWESARAPRKAA